MTMPGIHTLYSLEELQKVFEVAYRTGIHLSTGKDATAEEVQSAWQQYQQGFEAQGGLTDSEIAFHVNELLSAAQEDFRTVYAVDQLGLKPAELQQLLRDNNITLDQLVRTKTADIQDDDLLKIQEAEPAMQQAFQALLGASGAGRLGRPITADEARQRQTIQEQARAVRQRPVLIQQALGFLQANLPPSASPEYRQFVEQQAGTWADAYLSQATVSRAVGLEPPDFAQFIAHDLVNLPSEKAFRNQQVLAGGDAGIQKAAIQAGISQGLISSRSSPEEINTFLKDLLPRATQIATLQQQEAQDQGQPFDFLDALGTGLGQAAKEQAAQQEQAQLVRNTGIYNQKRQAEQIAAKTPIGDLEGLPFSLRNFFQTPIQGDAREQLLEQFFRQFLAETPQAELGRFTRPEPGFAQLPQGTQDLLEAVAQGKFPQFESPQAPQEGGVLLSQTPSQRAANQLFGQFLGQYRQSGQHQPFDLAGFLNSKREQFQKERLPQIDLESFLPRSSRPHTVGRNIFLGQLGGL